MRLENYGRVALNEDADNISFLGQGRYYSQTPDTCVHQLPPSYYRAQDTKEASLRSQEFVFRVSFCLGSIKVFKRANCVLQVGLVSNP